MNAQSDALAVTMIITGKVAPRNVSLGDDGGGKAGGEGRSCIRRVNIQAFPLLRRIQNIGQWQGKKWTVAPLVSAQPPDSVGGND